MKLNRLTAILAVSAAVLSAACIGDVPQARISAEENDSGVVFSVDGKEIEGQMSENGMVYDVYGLYHDYQINFLSDSPTEIHIGIEIPDSDCMLWDGAWDFSSEDYANITGTNAYIHEGEFLGGNPLVFYGATGDVICFDGGYGEWPSCNLKSTGSGSFWSDCNEGELAMHLTASGKGNIEFTLSEYEKETDTSSNTEETPQPEPEPTSPTISDEVTGVSVSGGIPEKCTLKVDRTFYNGTVVAYDITIVDSNGSEVQPTSAVEVRIPVPEEMADRDLKVFRNEGNEKYTDMKAKREGNVLVFSTDHFSVYAVTDRQLDNIGSESTENTQAPVPDIDYGFVVPETTSVEETAAIETPAVSTAVADSPASAPVTTAAAAEISTSAAAPKPADTSSATITEALGSTVTTASDKGKNPSTGITTAVIPVFVAVGIAFICRKKIK